MATVLDRPTEFRVPGPQMIEPFTVAAAGVIRKGVLVAINTATGFLVEATDVAARLFVGVSAEAHTATEGQSDIAVYTTGCFKFASTAIAQTNVGAPMFVTDNETFDPASAQFICCGKLTHRDSATVGWVDIGQAAVLTTAATGITFADGGAYVHFAALAAVNVDAAIEEDHLDLDQHACADGAGAVATSPSLNREHFAAAIEADGRGIAYLVQASAAGIGAMTVVAPTDYVAGLVNGIPEVTLAVNTTGTQPAKFYCPDAIVLSTYGWAYKVYTQENSGLNTAGSAVGDPVWNGVAGALTLVQPTGANRSQVVGRVITVAADGEVHIDFDDWNFYYHNHDAESCGGLLVGTVCVKNDAVWVKDGADKAIVTMPEFELPYDVVVDRAYCSVDVATGGIGTVVVKLNTVTISTFAAADTRAEDEALAVAVAADTDFEFTVAETAGGASIGLQILLVWHKTS